MPYHLTTEQEDEAMDAMERASADLAAAADSVADAEHRVFRGEACSRLYQQACAVCLAYRHADALHRQAWVLADLRLKRMYTRPAAEHGQALADACVQHREALKNSEKSA